MADGSQRPWFAPKTHGYGATPVTWEGWALVAAFAAAVIGAAWIFLFRDGGAPGPGQLVPFAATVAVLAVGLILVSKAKSSAEWRWRWGETDKS